jgi:hypothetical protein
MFQEPMSYSSPVSVSVSAFNSYDHDLLTGYDHEVAPMTIDQLAELKRQYASLLIQLDLLRPTLASADVLFRPADNEWSIKEVLGHLIDCDRDIWWPRISTLMQSDGARFEDVDQNDLVERHRWQSLPLEDILAQLMRVRWDYAMRLNALPDTLFERHGEHPVMGDVSILRIIQLLVAHDAHYVEKIRGLVEETRNGATH